ncbi:hypothetical protein [Candidatus Methylospira mobilis]|uniref:hypothetical protein n=1 Tax=Candidatus Methylospira mobilis TaxID=1808979 RepID=UPI001884CFCA|nr:hypothetical protein [Candidatus Methylospira mobilis]
MTRTSDSRLYRSAVFGVFATSPHLPGPGTDLFFLGFKAENAVAEVFPVAASGHGQGKSQALKV